MEQVSRNPLAIHCYSCGAPAEFDIIRQNYLCRNCGSETGIQDPIGKVAEWQKQQQAFIQESKNDFTATICSCPNCGARVTMVASEVTENCDFCNGKLVSRDFVNQEQFPECIIPFFITLPEAQERVKAWAKANPSKKEAREALSRLDELKGFYLPYQLFQGPVSCRILRDTSDRAYECESYLHGTAVNASKQLRNEVLDGMEPYDWSALRGFNFGYVAGQKVKLQDVTAPDLRARVLNETEVNALPAIEKAMQTTGLKLVFSGHLTSVPALLPAYVIHGNSLQLAVNGQTGRISVLAYKKSISLPWIIEPGIMIALIACLWFYLLAPDYHAIMIGTILAALPILIVYAENREPLIRNKLFQGKKIRAERDGTSLKLIEGNVDDAGAGIAKPVFFEKIKGVRRPVNIRFYPPGRLLSWGLLAFALIALPVLMAWLLTGIRVLLGASPEIFFTLYYPGSAAWLCLTLPVTLIFWITFGRRRIYDYPVIYTLDGSKPERITLKNPKTQQGIAGEFVATFVKPLLFEPELRWAGIILFLILLGSTGAVMF